MTSVLSSFFSRDPAKDFAYEIVQKTERDAEREYFARCKGRKKATNEEVTIFYADLKTLTASEVNTVKNCVRRLKTLKHPSILGFYDCLETDAYVQVVTENVIPLADHLSHPVSNRKGQAEEQLISWGLYQIAAAVNFLTRDAELIHDNVRAGTVFVNKRGDWKLFGLEYVRPRGSGPVPDCPKLYALERYSPPRSRLNSSTSAWALDCWGLACLIWEIFNGDLPAGTAASSVLKSPKAIPKSLHQAYAKLISSEPVSPSAFVELCRQPGHFMHNKLIDFLLCLEQFQLKDTTEKTRFFNQFDEIIELCPDNMLKYKILPQLINLFEFGDAGSKIITPMLRIGKLLDEAEYQKDVVPCLIKLFASPDRATRVKLLKEVENFVSYLQPNVVNDKIFVHFASGFMDTNPAVRESTVKAVVHLAPKLNYNNLNTELMKHFARLQAKDDQPGIRTNATVCLGKIAGYIDPQVRRKLLISAFTRAFRDPFPPARVAGVLALTATQQFYPIDEIAQRVLPALCPLAVDPEKQVREPVFRAVRGFIDKLEKVSENPELIAEMESQVKASSGSSWSGAESVPQWASWAFSALSSKFYKNPPLPQTALKKEPETNSLSTKTASTVAVEQKQQQQQQPSSSRTPDVSSRLGLTAVDQTPSETPTDDADSEPEALRDVGGGRVEGWDDDEPWESLEETKAEDNKNKTKSGWEVEDDGWTDF